MKVNKKLYDQVVSEAKLVQELPNNIVEIHSLNQNEQLYNQYTQKGKFSVWTSADGTNYRLLVEDGYYEKVAELYSKRVNAIWLEFWDQVETRRSKMMKTIFLPFVVVSFVALLLLMVLLGDNANYQTYSMFGILIVFLIMNMIINKKIDNMINTLNVEAVDKIKKIIGAKKFESLLDAQRSYIDEFFGYTDEDFEDDLVVEGEVETEDDVVESVEIFDVEEPKE